MPISSTGSMPTASSKRRSSISGRGPIIMSGSSAPGRSGAMRSSASRPRRRSSRPSWRWRSRDRTCCAITPACSATSISPQRKAPPGLRRRDPLSPLRVPRGEERRLWGDDGSRPRRTAHRQDAARRVSCSFRAPMPSTGPTTAPRTSLPLGRRAGTWNGWGCSSRCWSTATRMRPGLRASAQSPISAAVVSSLAVGRARREKGIDARPRR